MRRRFLALAITSLVLLAAAACAQNPADLSAEDRYRLSLAKAWGPESPETLEEFLRVREEIAPVLEANYESIQGWSLGHAGQRRSLSGGAMSAGLVQRALRESLENSSLSEADYQRLAILVYGRWLRCVREDPIPEKRALRILQEMEVAVKRQLDGADLAPELRDNLEVMERELLAQQEFVGAFALQDRAETLDRIDPAVKDWLEQNRTRVEELDFAFFDTSTLIQARSEPS